jgi:hypothetical protein
VSPPSGGGVGPSECSEGELSKHAPVFFEDALFGWCVGLVLGYTQRGWVAVKDAQRDRGASSLSPPPQFTQLLPPDFLRLCALSELPDLPPP